MIEIPNPKPTNDEVRLYFSCFFVSTYVDIFCYTIVLFLFTQCLLRGPSSAYYVREKSFQVWDHSCLISWLRQCHHFMPRKMIVPIKGCKVHIRSWNWVLTQKGKIVFVLCVCKGSWPLWSEKHTPAKWKTHARKHDYVPVKWKACAGKYISGLRALLFCELEWFGQSEKLKKISSSISLFKKATILGTHSIILGALWYLSSS
jgi:hypothetical protein